MNSKRYSKIVWRGKFAHYVVSLCMDIDRASETLAKNIFLKIVTVLASRAVVAVERVKES